MPEILDIPAPSFGYQLRVTHLTDRTPPPPGNQAPVATVPTILTTAGVQTWSAVFQTNTNVPGSEPVLISVVRRQGSETVRGSIEREGGGWYWIGGGQRIPLAPDDPCVTRVWPGGRSMSSEDYAHYCTTHVIAGFEEPVGSINLAYDLASERVSGEVSGAAGATLELHQGDLDISFVFEALDARSFERDVLPLFRPGDITIMKEQGMDLSSYDVVKSNATLISKALSYTLADLQMPCDGMWPPGPLLVFQQWMDQGMPR